jgi:hypothetical protein
MATTTTNFGWDIPQSTDLVKDGATAIAALGQDIDTAFVDFKGGTTGQVLKKTSGTDLDVEWGTASSGLTLINTTSFSGVASVSVPNSTFSATYTNYKIVTNIQSASGQVELFFRMRASGTDATGANYHSQNLLANNTTVAGERLGSATSGTFGQINNQECGLVSYFYKPFLAVRTTMTGQVVNQVDDVRYRSQGAMHSLATSYDAFTLICSQNITGTISVYGLAI